MLATSRRFSAAVPARRDDEPWALWSLAFARSIDDALADDQAFRDAAGRLSDVVGHLNTVAVAGASQMGRRLATAVAVQLGLPVWAKGRRIEGRLSLIDSVINTGVQLAQAADEARLEGASEVIAIGLVAQGEALTALDGHASNVIALEVV